MQDYENEHSPKNIRKPRALHKREKLDIIANKLRALPTQERKEVPTSEAISILSKEITSLLNRGYDFGEISTILSADGIQVSPSTLKTYLQSAKSSGKKTPRKKREQGATLESFNAEETQA